MFSGAKDYRNKTAQAIQKYEKQTYSEGEKLSSFNIRNELFA
jgi:hypothetical protein